MIIHTFHQRSSHHFTSLHKERELQMSANMLLRKIQGVPLIASLTMAAVTRGLACMQWKCRFHRIAKSDCYFCRVLPSVLLCVCVCLISTGSRLVDIKTPLDASSPPPPVWVVMSTRCQGGRISPSQSLLCSNVVQNVQGQHCVSRQCSTTLVFYIISDVGPFMVEKCRGI